MTVPHFLSGAAVLSPRPCYAATPDHGREGENMRKVRDYDAELKALGDKARALKAKKVQQLGELVTSTGADALDLDELAGVLLRSEEHTSELQSLMRISYAVFCLKKTTQPS